jgi:hypothetical protein
MPHPTEYTENDWKRDDTLRDVYDSEEKQRERECEEDDLREQERAIDLMTAPKRGNR